MFRVAPTIDRTSHVPSDFERRPLWLAEDASHELPNLPLEVGVVRRPRTRTPEAEVLRLELVRIMGTSVGMIERHYGALLDAAHESLLDRLEAVSGTSRA